MTSLIIKELLHCALKSYGDWIRPEAFDWWVRLSAVTAGEYSVDNLVVCKMFSIESCNDDDMNNEDTKIEIKR